MTTRSSLGKTSEGSPSIDRKFLIKKSNENTLAKKPPTLPTLPEESFAVASSTAANGHAANVISDTTDNQNAKSNQKSFLGSISGATSELSSSAASAVSLMVSNAKKTKTDFLAKELESRKELLHALVKDKNDTPV